MRLLISKYRKYLVKMFEEKEGRKVIRENFIDEDYLNEFKTLINEVYNEIDRCF